MSSEDDFRIRPGRIRSTRAQQARPFIAQALAAAQRAGGSVSRSGTISSGNRSRFGRGQRATVQANRLLTSRSRNTVIKTRVVRHSARATPLSAHLSYLRREGVTRDGEKARLFGPETEDADPKAFAERTQDDRHHFRFIVSPEDATEMSDLKTYARDLMGQMEKDLGTKLDWVGVDHWNTDNPHVHIILRGRTDDGQDLVISRDYIKEGMRARAQDLATQELGPRTDHEIRRNLERQIESERWTNLDRQLSRDAYRTGVVDLAPHPDRQPDEFHAMKVGRLRKLETLGLADQVGPGQWVVSENAEATLRELGERGDIIKRIHRGLTERGIERGAASYVLAGESLNDPVVGRLVDRGLDDELKGTAYAVVDGTDGRTHHIKLPDLDAVGDSAPGSIVELRELGERGDIIKRIHRGLTERGIERGAASYVLASESLNDPVVGRLVDRGLDDELKGTAYAIVDATDGRTHHIKLPDLDAAGDSAPGSIVELRKFDDAQGRRRVALAIRSDLDIERQVHATGATWLDRQAIAREPVPLGGGGFGAEVRQAMDRRADHLVGQGLAERQTRGVSFSPGLIDMLRQREVDALGEKLAAETGRQFSKAATGEYVAGTYRQRFALASGRFAMIDDGLGFQLVPWSPSLERQVGQHVSGVSHGAGGVDWSFGRNRGLGM